MSSPSSSQTKWKPSMSTPSSPKNIPTKPRSRTSLSSSQSIASSPSRLPGKSEEVFYIPSSRSMSSLRSHFSGEQSGQQQTTQQESSSFRRLSLLSRKLDFNRIITGKTQGEEGEGLSMSPTFTSAFMQRVSMRLGRSDWREASLGTSPPPNRSYLSADCASAVEQESLGYSVIDQLESALRCKVGFSRELVELFLSEHVADATRKLRFVMAVIEFHGTADKRERKLKGRKIIEIFLNKASVFNILHDLPNDVDTLQGVQSSSGMEKGLSSIKRVVLQQLMEIQLVKEKMTRLFKTESDSTAVADHEDQVGLSLDHEEDDLMEGELFEMQT